MEIEPDLAVAADQALPDPKLCLGLIGILGDLCQYLYAIVTVQTKMRPMLALFSPQKGSDAAIQVFSERRLLFQADQFPKPFLHNPSFLRVDFCCK
jgi:hypothetical protein